MSETKISRYIEKGCLMDDSFFELFFKKEPKYIEVVIREIFKHLSRPLVKIVSVSTQHNLKTFGGYDPRLDLLAEDEQGRKINIEVQRTVAKSHPKRARFHSSAIDTNSLPKGASYGDLPDTYVIFIMENDFRRMGLPAYEVERVFLDNGERFNDGSAIIYVNGEYRGDDPIGRLMNDFHAVRADTMKNKELAERMTFFKETEDGRRELSGLDAEIFEEGMKKERESVVLNLLKSGFSYVTIATACQYPESKVKELQDRFIKEGLLPA